MLGSGVIRFDSNLQITSKFTKSYRTTN